MVFTFILHHVPSCGPAMIDPDSWSWEMPIHSNREVSCPFASQSPCHSVFYFWSRCCLEQTCLPQKGERLHCANSCANEEKQMKSACMYWSVHTTTVTGVVANHSHCIFFFIFFINVPSSIICLVCLYLLGFFFFHPPPDNSSYSKLAYLWWIFFHLFFLFCKCNEHAVAALTYLLSTNCYHHHYHYLQTLLLFSCSDLTQTKVTSMLHLM